MDRWVDRMTVPQQPTRARKDGTSKQNDYCVFTKIAGVIRVIPIPYHILAYITTADILQTYFSTLRFQTGCFDDVLAEVSSRKCHPSLRTHGPIEVVLRTPSIVHGGHLIHLGGFLSMRLPPSSLDGLF